MAFNIILIVLILTTGILVNSNMFRMLLNRKIRFQEAVKLTCIAAALNKLFLAGSGYAAMSWKLKDDDLPVYSSLASFAALELFSVFPWLILGLYFGGSLAVKMPFFLIALLIIALIFAIYKKKKTLDFIKNVFRHFRDIKLKIPGIIILALVNLILVVFYYLVLFKAFGFIFPWLDVVKIATVSFTIGYLSPAPGGLGFKEGGLTLLLMQKNLSLTSALPVAITDRLIFTGFYIALGLLFGADLIINQIRMKFNFIGRNGIK